MISLNEFLSAFYPNDDEPIWFIGFPAKGLPDGHADKGLEYKKRLTRQTLRDNHLLQTNLKERNEHLGLYFVVNAGGTLKSDISRINAVFCEIDDLPMDEQHALYDDCSLKPCIRVETSKSVHAYWLLEDEMTIEQFCNVQNGLIGRFKADPKIKNHNRVMRLPHFSHLSWDDGYVFTKVKIHTFEPTIRYRATDLIAEFPYEAPLKPVYEAQGFIDDTWEGIQQELRYRISGLESYRVESNRTWGVAKGVCHDGNNNSALTVNLRTGAVSCKAGCDYMRILHHFGLEKPARMQKIPRVAPRPQSSELYQYIVENMG